MNIIIVEDELLIAEMLKEMLQDLGNEIKGIAKNYEEAIALIAQHNDINFCFLDITLKDSKSGFNVATYLMENTAIPFCFLTSYSDKSMISKAMQFKPEAYLIKPFTELDLFTTLEVIKNRKEIKKESDIVKTILIKSGSTNIKIPIDDILWIQSSNIYVEIKTNLKTYLVRNSLVKFLEEVNISCIKRIHRTFAVNLNHVVAANGQYLLVANEKLPISRKYREEILTNFR